MHGDEGTVGVECCGRSAYATRTGVMRCDRPKGHAGSHSCGFRPLAILLGLSWRERTA